MDSGSGTDPVGDGAVAKSHVSTDEGTSDLGSQIAKAQVETDMSMAITASGAMVSDSEEPVSSAPAPTEGAVE